LRRVLYRADRLSLPPTALPTAAIEPGDGWCDDPASPDYNRQVRLPIAASHEHLWRLDEIYDIVVVLGHNDDPPVAGAGSAIFLHVARPDYAPTQGCVAVARADLLQFLAACGPENFLTVSRG
jgi:L,D-peptidoglycan transpeptidase YkuD (ErfK/YbiS/YcfS/YnhG family)